MNQDEKVTISAHFGTLDKHYRTVGEQNKDKSLSLKNTTSAPDIVPHLKLVRSNGVVIKEKQEGKIEKRTLRDELTHVASGMSDQDVRKVLALAYYLDTAKLPKLPIEDYVSHKKSGDPLDFVLRVYEDHLHPLLSRDHFSKLDPALYNALNSLLGREPERVGKHLLSKVERLNILSEKALNGTENCPAKLSEPKSFAKELSAFGNRLMNHK